jgi:TetR/AcrR family transcriptional regulator
MQVDMPAAAEAPDTGRAASRKATEEKILEAAEGVFAERGFSGTTTAAIAGAAGLPKANVHYYFGTKKALYRAVLDNILDLWLAPMAEITEDADPARALTSYIKTKMWYSKNRPNGSKVFANEVLHGAPQISDYLSDHLRHTVEDKSAVLRSWMDQGRISTVDPVHLLFVIWAATQTYADFDVQVATVLGKQSLDDTDFAVAENTVIQMVLATCGLT